MNELVLHDPSGNLVVENRHREIPRAFPWFRHALGVARARWRIALAAAAIAFAIAALVWLLVPKKEYAEASLIINPVGDGLARPDQQPSSLPPDTSAVDTEVEVLRSPALALAVAKRMKLYLDPEFGGAQRAQPSDALLRSVVSSIEGHSRIRRIGLTYVVQVGFLASSTAKAKRIADGIIEAYLAQKLDQKLDAVTRANHDLGSTLGALRQQSLEAQARVDAYEAHNNLLGSNGTSLMESELSALNQQIADAQANSAEKSARLAAALAQAQSGSGGSDVGATLASNTIGSLRQKEADASATLSQLQTEFQSGYPAVQKASAQLNDIRRQLRLETARILSSLRADADVASRREASLLASRQQTATKLADNNKALAGLLTLQQDADTAKKIYETYLTRASELSADKSLQQVDATVESRAIALPGSFLASRTFGLIVALLLAALAAVAAILLSETWVKKIRSMSDVLLLTGYDLAGVLPAIEGCGRAGEPANQIANRPLTANAESFRSLRAFLAISAPRAKIIAVTSAVPGEGKTFTSVCLARSFAATGLRVALLDCDLRRASATKFFVKPDLGITEVMERSLPVERALVRDVGSGVWFLSGTTTGCVSGDMFATGKIDEVLARLAAQFDKVIIDTSPLLGFADARLFAAKANCVLQVVHWDKTPASMVHAAADILRQSGAAVAGVVLNKVDVKQQARYGFADGSDYYHYYSSAYAQRA